MDKGLKWHSAYVKLIKDERVSVWHISVYLAFVHLWIRNGNHNPVRVSRKIIMQLARIKGIATYHKCINELQTFGYIEYHPTYDYYKGTKVFLSGL